MRKTILKLSIELASTAQRDQFVDKPNEVIENSCITLAELCDRIVQELNDSLAIQPAVLDIVTVKKKPDEELGMHIHSSYSGIHIVGGIKFQSPAHRCGRIEEGDEIIQVSYQTVVGWQLKKLVSSMKEHPTEIVLTIKKRPRHSNLIGQVIVLKPYKIPNRRAGRQNSRLKNAATTTGSDGDDDAFLPNDNKSGSKPVYQLYPRKPKVPVRRRATISGSSPTVAQPPIRIEDLVDTMNKKESFNRSISHESPTNHLMPNRSRGLSVPSSEAAIRSVPLNANQNVNNNNVNNNSIKSEVNNKLCVNNNNIINANNNNAINTGNKPLSGNSPALPYAKVHPFPNEDPNYRKRSELETTPKKIVCSKETQSSVKETKLANSANRDKCESESEFGFKPLTEKSKREPIVETSRSTHSSHTQVGVVNPSPVTVMSYQLISQIQPKSASNNDKQTKEDKITRLLKSPLLRRRSPKESTTVGNGNQLTEGQPSPNTPVLRSEHKSNQRHCKCFDKSYIIFMFN